MADRYFVPVSGAGVWNVGNTTNWSATSGGTGFASAPTVADNVIFDQPGTYAVTMGTTPRCLNITVTAGTVNFTTSGSTAIVVTIAGSMSLRPGTTWNITAGVSTTTFSSTSAGRTITTYGTTFPCDVTFSGGGSWSFGSAFNVNVLRTTTLTSGTLNLNGYDLTTGIFLSTNTNTRSISFGSNNIVLAHTSAGNTVLSMTNATNFTWTGTGGFTATAAITRTYVFGSAGGSATNAPNLTLTGSGTAVQSFTSNTWFNKLDFGTTAFTQSAAIINVNSLTLSSGGTYTNLSITMVGTGTINTGGKTIAGFAINNGALTTTLAAAVSCSTYTQTAGTIDFANFNLTCSSTASYTAGTLTNTGTITCTTWTCAGTFTMTNETITPSTSFAVTGGFNYNGGTLSPVPTFTHTAGTVTLGKAYALTATGTYTLTAGSLTLNGFNLTTGIFASTGTGVRSINFGTGNVVLATTTAATTVLSMATVTNFTWTGTGGFVSYASVARTFTFGTTGGTTVNAPNLSISSGSAVTTFIDGSWFKTLDFTSSSNTPAVTASTIGINIDTLILATGGTYTGFIPTFTRTQTWTPQFSKQLGGMGVHIPNGTLTFGASQSFTATSIFNLYRGTLDLGGFDLTIGTFSTSNLNIARSITFSTNNIVLTGNGTVLAMADTRNFTYTGTGGFIADANSVRTFAYGWSAGGEAAIAINLTFTGSGTAVQTLSDFSWFKHLNFGTTAFTPSSTTINVDTLTLSADGTYTGLVPFFTRTQTWTPQFSKTFNGMGVNIPNGTFTFGASQSFTATAQFTLTAGTLDLNGLDLTIGTFISNISNTRSISFGTNNIILSTTTVGATNLTMNTATGFTYTGTGGFTAAANITRTFSFGISGGTTANSINLTFTGSGTAVQTLTSLSWFKHLNFGTTAFNPGSTNLNIFSLTLSTSGTYTSVTPTMRGTGTITSNGKTINGLIINHTDPTGVTTLATALNFATADSSVNLTQGTLDLSGFDLTTGRFSGSGTGVRSIIFGSNNITLATTTASVINLSMADASNFTYTGTGGFITAMSVARSLYFGSTNGGSTANAPNLSITSGSAVPTFTGGSWFKTLNFTGSTCAPAQSNLSGIKVDTLILATGGTYTGFIPHFTRTQTWTAQFSKQLGGIGFRLAGGTLTLDGTQTFTATSSCDLIAGTLDLNGFNLTVGSFASSGSFVRSIIFGTNNIILSTPTTGFVLDINILTGFSCTGTGGFVTDAAVARSIGCGESSPAGDYSTVAPNLTFTGNGSAAIQFGNDNVWFNNLNFGTTTFNTGQTGRTPIINLTNLTLSAGGTYTTLTPVIRRTGTINTNGKTIAGLTINCPGGTATFAGAVTTGATGTATLSAGTLDLSSFNLTTGIFSASGTTTRSIVFGSTNITLVHTTAAQTVLNVANATGFTCSGTGGFTSTAGSTKTFTFGTTGGSSTNSPNLTISGGAAVTLTNGSWFNHLLFTSGFSNTTAGNNTPNLNSLTLGINGGYSSTSFTMVGTGIITSNGKEILNLTIDCPGGTTTLAEAFTVQTFTLTQGTFNVNNFIVTVGTNIGSGFISSNSNTRSIAFGTGSIQVNGSAGFGIQMANATNFTWTGTGGFGSDTTTSGRVFTFGSTAGGSASNAPNFTITGGNLSATFTAGSWFKILNIINTSGTFTGGLIYVDTLSGLNSGDYSALIPIFTRTQTWSMLNNKQLGGIGVNGAGVTLTLDGTQTYTATSVCYLTQGTLNLGGANLTIGSFSSSNSNTRAIAFGTNNIILATTTAGATNLDMANTFNFTYTGTGGFVAAADITRIFGVGTVGPPVGGDVYSTPGTYSWTAPAGVTSVSVVAVGAGGGGYNGSAGTNGTASGGGGGLGWKNNITVVPGQSYTVVVGASYRTTVRGSAPSANGEPSYFINLSTVAGLGGGRATAVGSAGAGGAYVGDGGGNGGNGAFNLNYVAPGGGGAGGYSGNGGNAQAGTSGSNPGAGLAGSGGGGGSAGGLGNFYSGFSGAPGSGGGVGIYGQGASGAGGAAYAGGGANPLSNYGLGGSDGGNGGVGVAGSESTVNSVLSTSTGGAYGGGGSGVMYTSAQTPANGPAAGGGAVRIIWGPNRSFPSTNLSAAYEAAAESSSSTITPANAINLSFTGVGTAIQTIVTGSTIKNLNFGTTGFAIQSATIINVDTLTLSSSGTYSNLTPLFTRTQTWTPQFSKQLGGIGVSATGVTLTLEATQTYVASPQLIVDDGTLNLNGITFIASNFLSRGTGTRSITGSGVITVNNSWVVNYGVGFTGSSYTINVFCPTFAGSGGSYGTLVQQTASQLNITGSNTFVDIQVNNSMPQFATTITFQAGSTTTLTNFTVTGVSGNLATITSSISGTRFNLLKPTGTTNVNYLNIQDSNASSAFFSNLTSIDLGNNIGWNFTAPAVVQSGFSAFF